MGKLGDVIKAKVKGADKPNINFNVRESIAKSPVQKEMDEQATTAYYNRSWLSRVALHQGFVINPDDKKVDGVLAALNRKNGYCPCGGTGAQFKCPCEIMRTHGICKCGLYLNVPDRKIENRGTTIKVERN